MSEMGETSGKSATGATRVRSFGTLDLMPVSPVTRRLTVSPTSGSFSGMALHLIIDGYNLLAQTSRIDREPSRHSEMARESLLRDLASYRQRKSHPITVVFDGWQHGWGTEQREHRLGLQIIFSRRGEKADQVIQRMVAEFGSACAVVSSDHEIIDCANAQGAFVMKAQEFIGKLRQAPNLAGASAHKELAREENLRPKSGPKKRGNPRKLPKALRQRSRQLKRF